MTLYPVTLRGGFLKEKDELKKEKESRVLHCGFFLWYCMFFGQVCRLPVVCTITFSNNSKDRMRGGNGGGCYRL